MHFFIVKNAYSNETHPAPPNPSHILEFYYRGGVFYDKLSKSIHFSPKRPPSGTLSGPQIKKQKNMCLLKFNFRSHLVEGGEKLYRSLIPISTYVIIGAFAM